MHAPYSPLDFMEALAKERRRDPRVDAANATSVTERSSPRRRLGLALVRIGGWLAGARPEAATGPA